MRVVTLVIAVAALVLAFAAPGRGEDRPRAAVYSAAGAAAIANSLEGEAVFGAVAMRPGDAVTGTVTIGNDGDAAGRFSLAVPSVVDAPGPYGGRLSDRVRLELATAGATIYAGPPAGLGDLALGRFAPGEQREYTFTLTLPDGGVPATATTGDNRFQGSSLTLGLRWRAATGDATATPTPTPTTPTVPKTPATPPAKPGAPARPTAGRLGLPSARRCVRRRGLRLRLRAPDGAEIVSVRVRVGRHRKTVHRARFRIRPPATRRRFRVRVAIRTADGHRYRASRRYRRCR